MATKPVLVRLPKAAIYGTDAVAGVVNFITDDKFKGSAVNVRLATLDGAGDQNDASVEAKFGWGSGNTDFMVAASYFDRSPLSTEERRFSRPQDDSSVLGNPGSFFSRHSLDVGCCCLAGARAFVDVRRIAQVAHTQLPQKLCSARRSRSQYQAGFAHLSSP